MWTEVTSCEVFKVQLGGVGKLPFFTCEAAGTLKVFKDKGWPKHTFA